MKKFVLQEPSILIACEFDYLNRVQGLDTIVAIMTVIGLLTVRTILQLCICRGRNSLDTN